jgi:MFS transporter, DHA2 family, multidrug resistance protein
MVVGMFDRRRLALSVMFVRRQTRLADPLIDMRLFKVPAFSVALAAYTLATFVAFGAFVFIAHYMQLVLGLSPWHAGLWTTPFAAAFIIGSTLTPMIARRVRPALVMVGGLAIATVGFGVLTQVDGPSALAVLVTAFVVYSLGVAAVFTLATDLIVGSAPPERAGVASAISETGSEFGGALGIAILGSIGTAVYRGVMADVMPKGIPPEAAGAVRDTLAGAVAVAGRLPDQLGSDLLGVARTAFTQAMEVTAICSAAIVLAMAIVAALLLQRTGTGAELDQHLESADAATTSVDSPQREEPRARDPPRQP